MSATAGKVGIVETRPIESTSAITQAEVAALGESLAQEANELMQKYNAATPEEQEQILANQTLGQAIDQFVIDCKNGKIVLPDGVDPVSVVAPAVKPLLEAGMDYSIEIPNSSGIGGRAVYFGLDPLRMPPGAKQDSATGVYWSEPTLR